MSDFRVPKQKVEATARLPGQAPRSWELYLAETAEMHSGRQRVSDLLNGRDRFLPVYDTEEGYVVANVDAIIALTVPAEFEHSGDGLGVEDLAAELAVKTTVAATLYDGTVIDGVLVYVQPEGQRRLQDYMNAGPQFITLRDGDQAHLINTHHVCQLRTVATEA